MHLQTVVLNDTNNHVNLLTETLPTKGGVTIKDSVLRSHVLFLQSQWVLVKFT